MLTTLLLFYIEGTQPGTDIWVIGTAYASIIILYVIPMNWGFRQNEINKIINISDLEIYSKIADRIESRVKLKKDKDLQEAEGEIEKIVSDFKNSIDSFLVGDFDSAIIQSCNVREGVNRIFHNWLGAEEQIKFLEEEFVAQKEWRQNIAHSQVRHLRVSGDKKREKQKEQRKKLDNQYISVYTTNNQKALSSIRFALAAIDYLVQWR